MASTLGVPITPSLWGYPESKIYIPPIPAFHLTQTLLYHLFGTFAVATTDLHPTIRTYMRAGTPAYDHLAQDIMRETMAALLLSLLPPELAWMAARELRY